MADIKFSAATSVGTGYMEVCGAQIYYEWRGKGDALVLLHGGGLDCGKSSAPTEPFSDAGILCSLLKHLDITQAHLLGNSLGGKIALDFAVEYQHMVKSLILVAPGLSGYELSSEYMRQIGVIFFRYRKGRGIASHRGMVKASAHDSRNGKPGAEGSNPADEPG